MSLNNHVGSSMGSSTVLKKEQLGLTIIELMIALALSAFMMTAIYQVVLSNRVNISVTEAQARVQESGRLALEIMARDIRMAGYGGCITSDVSTTSLLDETDPDYDPELHNYNARTYGYENHDGSTVTFGSLSPKAGTDSFGSRSATTTSITVAKIPTDTAAALKVPDNTPPEELALLEAGAVLLVTDCTEANVFTVSTTTKNPTVTHNTGKIADAPDNKTKEFTKKFPAGSDILVMNSYSYFIAPSAAVRNPDFGVSGKVNNAQEFVDSLYKFSMLGGNDPLEMVPNVEDLQITYGVDNNADNAVDVYMNADEIATAGLTFHEVVKSVKVDIVVSGVVDVGAPQLAGFLDDGRLRKRFTRVIQIRNSI